METQAAFIANTQLPAQVVTEAPKSMDGGPSVTLTIRLIMQGKEVGSIIGKKGDNIKKFREESGAKINISDGSCPERIVTVTGSTEAILKAFSLIARKFEEDCVPPPPPGAALGKPQVTLRLIVPASQCGSLIGKGGAKIKEIREITGATIQVASEMLPNSTERAVTVSGNSDAITKCIYQICCVMMESPPKGATIPYRPKPAMPPVIFAGGQAYTIQGQYAIPHPDLTKLHQLALQHAPLLPGQNVGLNPQALASLAASNPVRQPPAASAPMASGAPSTTEMTIPNDLIGCIIGKGGAKINEIRQLSGATIKISNTEEGSKDRTVAIAGTPESINLAQYLINTSMDLHKNLTHDPNNPSNLSSTPQATATASLTSNPMANLAATVSATVSPSSAAHSALTFATDCLNNSFSSQARPKPLTTKLRATPTLMAVAALSQTTATGLENGLGVGGGVGGKSKADRKFAPY